MFQFLKKPLWEIGVGRGFANRGYALLIFFSNFLCALMEGGSFALMLAGFSALEGQKIEELLQFSQLGGVSFLGFLSHFTQIQLFYFFILMAIFLQALRCATSFIALYATSLLSLRIQTEAQLRVYKQIFRFSFSFVSNYKIGDLTEYAKTPAQFIPVLFDALNRFLVSALMIASALGIMFWISSKLTLITLGLFGIFGFLQKYLISKVARASESLTEDLTEFSHQTVQSLQGIRPIHIFNRNDYIIEKIKGLLNRLSAVSKKVYLWNSSIPALNEMIGVLVVGATMAIGSFYLIKSHSLVLPSLLTYLALSYRVATRLQNAMGYLGSAAVLFGFIKRLNSILDPAGKEFSPENGKNFPGLKSGLKRGIEFQKVSLHYGGANSPALNDLSFEIQKGSVTAFVGLSGAGKSSVLDLLLRLYEPTAGRVLVDSENLQDFSLGSWRDKLGVVSQESFIFNDSIEQNIRFGFLEADDDQVVNAARAAGAHEFISKLPCAYQTVVGERGYRLSGGERQRLALARALLRNPEILVLDEATSNLDSHSESLIQEFLEKYDRSKTIIIVAHRLSTICKSDAIYVLEQGRIIESGRHQELLHLRGRYAYLWDLQSKEQASFRKPRFAEIGS